MSLDHALFYKSVNGDRVYDDTSFEHWLKKFFTSGVFLNDLQVTANNDMTVTVNGGYVNIDGKVKIFENPTPLIIETAGATYPRIDSIVLERNDTERDITLKVVKGGYSSLPLAHTPVREEGVYQLVIAQIWVDAGVIKITQADISDTRSNKEICGFVAAAVDQIDFSQVQAQFDSYIENYKIQAAEDYAQYNEDMEAYLDQIAEDFATWFEGIRNQLDEDAAGHLQNQIDDINSQMKLLGGSRVKVNVSDNEGKYNIEGLDVNLVVNGKTYTEKIPRKNIVVFTGVMEVGEAKITCVDVAQEFNAETTIEIPYYGDYETSISTYNLYKHWLEAAGYSMGTYPTLQDVLADEKAVRKLMSTNASCDVFIDWYNADNTIIEQFTANRIAMKWIGLRNYITDKLFAIPSAKESLLASEYRDYILKPLVPAMTSNTAPYGTCSATTIANDGYPAWSAFNGEEEETKKARWQSKQNSTNNRVGYTFVNPTLVNRVCFSTISNVYGTCMKNYEIQATNDNATFVTLYSGSVENKKESLTINIDVEFDNTEHYMSYYILFKDTWNSDGWTSIKTIQFYGRQIEALIPPMTSNTMPSGAVSASSTVFNNIEDAYKVFDADTTTGWMPEIGEKISTVSYTFENPMYVRRLYVLFTYLSYNKDMPKFKLEASNNGKDFVDLMDYMDISPVVYTQATGVVRNIEIESNNYYRYYRFSFDSLAPADGAGNHSVVRKIQLYGTPDHELRNYIYDNGVEFGCESMNAENGWGNSYTYEEPVYNNDNIVCDSIASGHCSGLSTSAMKNLSSYNSVKACMDGIVAESNSYGGIGLYSDKEHTALASTSLTSGDPVSCLDVSNISSECYVAVRCLGTRKFKCYALWLE